MDFFIAGFWLLSCICISLYLWTSAAIPSSSEPGFTSFQRTYIVVYILAMAGERLQGPHVYDLYESYDMTTQELDRLFVAGFTSSMVVGTYLGYAADKYGRRTSCMLYGILNGAACIAKHFPNFWILILGRVLDGASTSLLYSASSLWVC